MTDTAQADKLTPPLHGQPADMFNHLRAPVPELDVVDVGARALRTVDDTRGIFAQCSNPRVTPEFIDRIGVVGAGKYGTAIADLLSIAGNDVAIFARDAAVANDIEQSHRNTKCLGDRPLSRDLRASSSRGITLTDRGIVMLAVPTMALEDQINSLKPHPDSIVVNLAKGLIIKGWRPDTDNADYRSGPPKGAEVFLPLEFMRAHPNFEFVKALCMVAGPGFADELKSGNALDLSVAAHYRDATVARDKTTEKMMGKQVAAHVAQKFNKAEVTTELTTDYVGVQIAAAMKNVISVMVGVCDGLTQAHGDNTFPQNLREKIMRFGMQEAGNIIKWKGGKHKTLLEPCGYPDLHLSTSSTTGRNYSLGLALASGGRVDKIIQGSGNIVEGALAAWAIKILTDDKPGVGGKPGKAGIYTPITNALIDIFGGMRSPSVVMDQLLGELKEVSMNEIHEWQSDLGRTGVYKPKPD